MSEHKDWILQASEAVSFLIEHVESNGVSRAEHADLIVKMMGVLSDHWDKQRQREQTGDLLDLVNIISLRLGEIADDR